MTTKSKNLLSKAAGLRPRLWKRMNAVRSAISALDASDVEVGVTPKDEIARDGEVRLYRYRPTVDNPMRVPVILAYALVGRYTVADLQPDRSLVNKLLGEGMDVYVIDWGHPKAVG